MSSLNFHHLHSFWSVAREGHLTRAAEGLHVAPSALSAQIRQLEEHLGTPLFHRQGRRLVLTEAGKIALVYADDIFRGGAELVATLQEGRRGDEPLRIGAVATLSRNFLESFLRPWLGRRDAGVRLVSGRLDDLVERLRRHELDVVLGNRPPEARGEGRFSTRLLARQQVSVVGPAGTRPLAFPGALAEHALLVPGRDSDVRSDFDAWVDRLGLRVHVMAEVDDMATLRLLARDTGGLAVLPAIVVRDELDQGLLVEHAVVPEVYEHFYAVTVDRLFPHPLLEELLARQGEEILGPVRPAAPSPRPGRRTGRPRRKTRR